MPSPPDSREKSDRQERRFLIAAGTAQYKFLPDNAQLPSVRDDLRLIVELFTEKLGYKHVLPNLGENPTTRELNLDLSSWLRQPDRDASDVIVVYYSGHGGVEGGIHYLLTNDSQETNLIGTALPTANLGRMLYGTNVQQLLVLLDTCYSGQGAVDFFQFAGEVFRSLGGGEELPSGFYVIAAARPRMKRGRENLLRRSSVPSRTRPRLMQVRGKNTYCSIPWSIPSMRSSKIDVLHLGNVPTCTRAAWGRFLGFFPISAIWYPPIRRI